MEWTTHALSGIALGYMVTGEWKGAMIGGIASIIPDLDEPRSKFGKVFFFISFPLSRFVQHRTLTHSLLLAIPISLIVGLATMNFEIGLATLAGILAHDLGDMVTGKVQFLYPLKQKIGIHVSRFQYLLIDRITRVALLLLLGNDLWHLVR